MFNIYDVDNNIVECETLFTFIDNNKSFIVYLDKEGDILASFYEIKDDKMVIYPITDDRDFDIVDREIEKRR